MTGIWEAGIVALVWTWALLGLVLSVWVAFDVVDVWLRRFGGPGK